MPEVPVEVPKSMPLEIDPVIAKAMDQSFADGHAGFRAAATVAVQGVTLFAEAMRLESMQSRQLSGAKAATALLTDDSIGRSILTQRAVADQPGAKAA